MLDKSKLDDAGILKSQDAVILSLHYIADHVKITMTTLSKSFRPACSLNMSGFGTQPSKSKYFQGRVSLET